MNTRHLQLPLALGLILASSQANALGLGQIEVKSGLNQPLLAEIPILSASPAELDELQVRLASPEAFARVGLERPVGLTANLQMALARNSRGQPVIRVTTPNRFNEPFLTFLLEVNTGRGGVVREFSALVDPPYIAPAVIRPLEAPAVAAVAAPSPVLAPPPVKLSEPAPAEAETRALADAEPAPVESAPEPPPAPLIVENVPAPEPQVAAQPEPLPQPEPAPEPEIVPEPEPEPLAAAPEPPPEPEPEPQPVVAPPPPPPPQLVAAPPPAPEPPAPAAQPDRYGPVGAGQTLWSIANSVRPDAAISVNQMMLALQRANPEAFIGDNINSLKRGAVLRIPVSDEIAAVSAEQAAALVRDQANAWQARRAPVPQPAEAVVETPATPAAPRPAAPRAAAPAQQGRLAIVPPSGNARDARGAQSGASQAGGGSELRAQLSQAREDLAAREAEVTELKSRVAELESEQSNRQTLVEMQNSQLKALQDRLAQLEGEKTAAAAAPPAAAAGAGDTDAETESPDASADPAPATADAPATAVAAAPAPPAESAPKPTPTTAADGGNPADTGEQAGPWYLNPMVLGGGALVLLGGLVFALRGRRREGPMLPARRISDDEALKASLATSAPAAAKEEAAPAAAKPAPAPAPAAPPAAKPAAPAPAPAAPAPSAAELALKSLQDAIKARPNDPEAHLNLLRHHYSRGEAREYEAVAQNLRKQVTNTADPFWREAVVMGVALLPGNPLFSEAGWNKPRFADADAPAAPAPAADTARMPEPVKTYSGPPTMPSKIIPPLAPKPAPVGEEDIADLESLVVAEPPAEPGSIASDEDWDVLNEETGNGDDLHRTEAEVLAEDEGSATKIELAKAYLEIGDADGARGMLQEVVAEGGPRARAEAERLLKEIG